MQEKEIVALLLCQAKGEHSREQKIHTYYEQKANEGKHVSIENQVTSLGKWIQIETRYNLK